MIIEIIYITVLSLILLIFILVKNFIKQLKNKPSSTNLTGFEIAKKVAINEPHIIKKDGFMLDHFNLDRNVIKLSADVFNETNLYATLVAFAIAYLTHTENHKYVKIYKLCDFSILVSYILIIIGGFINSTNAIYLGMVLFIIIFLIELRLITIFKDKTVKIMKEYQIINETDNVEGLEILGFSLNLLTLPFHFVVWFR